MVLVDAGPLVALIHAEDRHHERCTEVLRTLDEPLATVSINELARRLERHYKNVHTDVTRLIELGLIERRDDQRVEVVWDIVAAEMKLAA